MVFQPEVHPAVPARAGDGARDGRQRPIWPPLPFEATLRHRDDLFDALPFAQEPSASDGAVAIGADAAHGDIAAIKLFAQGFQPPDRIGLQPAIGQFLDAPPDIIVIDPIRNLFDGGPEGGGENDNTAMMFFLKDRVEVRHG